MPFAAGLRESLQARGTQVPEEFTRGDTLEQVLNRHLLTVERMSDRELLTSILLLNPDGTLSHGAAPNLPRAYREAIDGSKIGPRAGSCGSAAYFGRPVYVRDIASDPLWNDYRKYALPHGLRSCWSTPIRDTNGSLIGTFAIYHREPSDPSPDEIDAIDAITELVAHAIMWSRGIQDLGRPARPGGGAPKLRLVGSSREWDTNAHPTQSLMRRVERLEVLAADLDRHAETAALEELQVKLKAAADDCRRLVSAIRLEIEQSLGTPY
jgi:hypothetical protein